MLPFNGRNRVTSIYGNRTLNGKQEFHRGLDIVGDDDTNVRSVSSGLVIRSTYINDKASGGRNWELGNYIVVQSTDGKFRRYQHLASRTVNVGDQVKIGDTIGIMGNTGYSFGAHLHYQVYTNVNNPNTSTVNPAEDLGIDNVKGIYTKSNKGEGNMPTYYGIDVSKYQGNIDWSKVNVDFAIIRAGYGKYISQKDPKFEEYYKGAKNKAIPVGAYWYSYAKSVEEAKLEASIFLEVVKGKQFEYPLYFDIEDNSMKSAGKAKLTEICIAFCTVLEEAGYFAGVYSYTSFINSHLDINTLSKKYTIWLADYRSNYDKVIKRDIHQYSSSGNVDGIYGAVDMDKCTRDFPTIIKNAGLNGFSKADYTPKVVYKSFKVDKATEGDINDLVNLAKSKNLPYKVEVVE